MAHFYGIVRGQARTETTRVGSKNSGIQTIAASWKGAITVDIYYDSEKNKDICEVRLTKWHGAGTDKLLYHGPVSGTEIPVDAVPV